MAQKGNEHKRDMAGMHFEYAKVITNFIKEGKHDLAEAYVDDLVKASKHQTSSKAFHHSLIHACSKMGSPAGAIWCALRMVRTGLKPNIVTFNALLDTAAKTGDIGLAKRLWELVLDLGLGPNSITYNTMINAYAKANEVRLAEEWLNKMLVDGMPMCAMSFQSVIAASTRVGDYERAEGWFAAMKQSGVKPDRVIFNSMIWARSSQPAHVEHWLLEMEKSGLVPDDKAYATMVNLWLKHDCADKALTWYRKMESHGFRPSKQTLAAVIEACMTRGDEAGAKHVLEKVFAKGPDAKGEPQSQQQHSRDACWCAGANRNGARGVAPAPPNRKTACAAPQTGGVAPVPHNPKMAWAAPQTGGTLLGPQRQQQAPSVPAPRRGAFDAGAYAVTPPGLAYPAPFEASLGGYTKPVPDVPYRIRAEPASREYLVCETFDFQSL